MTIIRSKWQKILTKLWTNTFANQIHTYTSSYLYTNTNLYTTFKVISLYLQNLYTTFGAINLYLESYKLILTIVHNLLQFANHVKWSEWRQPITTSWLRFVWCEMRRLCRIRRCCRDWDIFSALLRLLASL